MGGADPRPPWGPGPEPWTHRLWCAPDCEFRSGAVEGTHLSVPWVLCPGEGEQAERIALRLAEVQPGPDGAGELRVLVSVTERRLADDLDPFGEYPGQGVAGLVAITSSVGLDADESLRVFEQLEGYARCVRELSAGGGDRGSGE